MQRVEIRNQPRPIPKGESQYREYFRPGANFIPKVLVKIGSFTPSGTGAVTATTMPSIHPPWNRVNEQKVFIPQEWLLPFITSDDMLAFSLRLGNRQRAIVPIDNAGNLIDHVAAMQNPDWNRLNVIYEEFRGKGGSTPKTLLSQIDFHSKLSRQLPLNRLDDEELLRCVLYPKSGDYMRGCRINGRKSIVDNTLYYITLETPNEVAFLVALLNAPSLCLAFRESRTSGRDFAKRPFECVPIPKYDPANDLHQELVNLTVEAEAVATTLLKDIQNNKKGKNLRGQDALSKLIRARLVENRISGRIDDVVAKLLPEQVR